MQQQRDLLDDADPDWPPDPVTIDLNNPDWLTIPQAAYLARVTERTLWRQVAARDIAIKVLGRTWVSRRRLFSQ